ncbi:MAG: SDR family oxidoreductase [Pseudomonadota bacterium]
MNQAQGKTVLITGASRGIGAAAARSFVKAGAKVVLAARSSAEIEALASEINDAGGAALAVTCDVTSYTDVEAAVNHACASFGGIDVLVNNAGIIDPIGRIEELAAEDYARVIDVNVKGVFHGLKAALPRMTAAGSGVIINISSGAATSALEGWSHYCSSKAAVLSLTRCADKELGDSPVRVVGLSPGTVATEMQVAIKASGINPVSALDPSVHIPADWVGEALVWLASPDADEYRGVDVSLREEDVRRRVGLTG